MIISFRMTLFFITVQTSFFQDFYGPRVRENLVNPSFPSFPASVATMANPGVTDFERLSEPTLWGQRLSRSATRSSTSPSRLPFRVRHRDESPSTPFIPTTMFADELKTLRRLGFRHVCRVLDLMLKIADIQAGLAANPQLRIRPGDGPNDMERTRSRMQYRVTHSRSPQVRTYNLF